MSVKIDLGEDKNFFEDDNSGKNKIKLGKILDDNTAAEPDDALRDAKIAVWENWINADPLLTAYTDEQGTSYLFYLSEELEKKTILLHFWDYSLLPCLREIEYLKIWHERYASSGLFIIGVHSPKCSFGKDKTNLFNAVRMLGITYPVVLDNEFLIWKSLENRYWPRRCLLSPSKEVIADEYGEGNYTVFEKQIQNTLRQASPGLSCPQPILPLREKLDETGTEIFLGFKNKPLIGNLQNSLKEQKEIQFQSIDLNKQKPGALYFEGKWIITEDSMLPVIDEQSVRDQSTFTMHLNFIAKNLYFVAQSKATNPKDIPQAIRTQISLNGKAVAEEYRGSDLLGGDTIHSNLTVHGPRVYQVLKDLKPESQQLKLSIQANGIDTFEFFAIFFENES